MTTPAENTNRNGRNGERFTRGGGVLRSTIALAVAFLLPADAILADPVGLTQRPQNLTCIAPDRPIVDVSAALQPAWPGLSFVTVPDVDDLDHRNGPISMAQIPGDNSHWYIAERAGRVHRALNDDSAATFSTVLDIQDRFEGIDYFQQWGINAIAFHPDFASNGWLFVLYNDSDGPGHWVSRVSLFSSRDGGLTFAQDREQVLLSYQQDSQFHHFDDLHFGPDGNLYIASGASASLTGQATTELGGKMLRINVDAMPYTIPADNPFAEGGGAPEIYATGLRNPWRFAFDSATGDLWLGDLGSTEWEEINIISNGGNYGWKLVEGTDCVMPGCNTAGIAMPLFQYAQTTGVGIIGGVVYRGDAIPDLQGTYLFSDFLASAPIWGLQYDTLGEPTMAVVADSPEQPTGFAEGNDGEVLVYAVGSQGNLDAAGIERLVPLPGRKARDMSTFPELLSETGCVNPADPTEPATGLIPYDVLAPLWSDHASKRRWMALPENTTIDIDPNGNFSFPIGTVLVKEFSINGAPVETRLMMRHDDGLWAGYSYEWNDDLSDAFLLPAGKMQVIDENTTWVHPSRPQCLQCHTGIANFSLGLEIAQLNGSMVYPGTGIDANQLATLEHIGMFTDGLPAGPAELPALASPLDSSESYDRRARAYLHSNCSNCHRPGSGVPTAMDLRFSTPINATGTCSTAPVHGDLGVPGAQLIYPTQPGLSVLPLRMQALDINRMPSLGSDVVDTVGVQLLNDWISTPEVCDNPLNDLDGDGITSDLDNCTDTPNIFQHDTDGDGIGNACDADLNNDCVINPVDLGLLRAVFFSANPDADFDTNGVVNIVDLGIMKSAFFNSPGPSGIPNLCD